MLRKDPAFGEKIYKKLKDLIKDEQIVDEKKIEIILNILYNILSNGKFDLENIDSNYDITKNQNILTLMINIFKIEKDDNNQKQPLLNLIIRIIGLFIKQFFFFPKEIDISIFSEFLRFVPNVLSNKE